MGQPAAKQGDNIVAIDVHLVQPPGPVPPAPAPFPFKGTLDAGLSADVRVQGLPAATLGSTATNLPPHIGPLVVPPRNQGRIIQGSTTVFINGKPAARAGDRALTCNDPVDLPVGTVVAISTVLIGG